MGPTQPLPYPQAKAYIKEMERDSRDRHEDMIGYMSPWSRPPSSRPRGFF